MKRLIGRGIATVGARLWQSGGFYNAERYNDLKVTGKVGFRMLLLGLKLMGLTPDDVVNM